VKRPFLFASFLLKVGVHQGRPCLRLHDLHSGERLDFASWQALERFVERRLRRGLR
jgi:hypothetical protein